MMTTSFASTDYSPLRLVELGKTAELLGTALAASGDATKAQAVWRDAAELLDRQANRTFHFSPVRRLLAIDLGQDQVLAPLEAKLQDAGYRDARMEPEYTLSGKFRPAPSGN